MATTKTTDTELHQIRYEFSDVEKQTFATQLADSCQTKHQTESDKKEAMSSFKACAKPRKWKTVIVFRRKNIFIGQFDDEKQAYLAYKKKVKELGIINRYVV